MSLRRVAGVKAALRRRSHHSASAALRRWRGPPAGGVRPPGPALLAVARPPGPLRANWSAQLSATAAVNAPVADRSSNRHHPP